MIPKNSVEETEPIHNDRHEKHENFKKEMRRIESFAVVLQINDDGDEKAYQRNHHCSANDHQKYFIFDEKHGKQQQVAND